MSKAFIIEVFVCLAFVILYYQCCVKGSREQDHDDDGNNNDDENHEDLRRFRERISERGGFPAAAAQTGGGESTVAARKDLIEKNLFSRIIKREESVKELSRLLAISRGRAEDEELGECSAQSGGNGDGGVTTTTPPGPPASVEPSATMDSDDSSLLSPSAPLASSPTAVDTIATALSSSPPDPPATNSPQKLNPITLEPIRNLINNLTQNIQSGSERSVRETSTRSAREMADEIAPTSGQKINALPPKRYSSTLNPAHKLECSICLDSYSSDDTICWAKDGGDPPSTLSSANVFVNNDTGCDHIFHKECIVAWLQDHDECPMCRRKVVHQDADVRYAGWEM